MHKLLSINDNFQTKQALAPLLERCVRINQLNQFFQTLLPETAGQYCRVANVREYCIVLQVDSPTWTTRLVYQLPELLKSFQEKFPELGLCHIDYFVSPIAF